MLNLADENIGMLVDDILKHLVTETDCMQINACLVEETDSKSCFPG